MNRCQSASMILVVVSMKEAVALVGCYMILDFLASWVVDNPNRINMSNQSQVVQWHSYRPLPLSDDTQMRTLANTWKS